MRSLPAILVVAALVLAGCGSTDDDSPDGRFVEPETTPAETATATAPAEQPVTITEHGARAGHADRDGARTDTDLARGVPGRGG